MGALHWKPRFARLILPFSTSERNRGMYVPFHVSQRRLPEIGLSCGVMAVCVPAARGASIATFEVTFEDERIGMQMEQRGDRIFVEATAEDSPARALGVLDGDEILCVGDEEMPTDVDAVGDLISGSPRPLVVIFQRAPNAEVDTPEPPIEPGAVEEIVFETDAIGIEIREDGGRFFVEGAPPAGSAAALARVRSDWEIVRVSGGSELPESLDALCELIASSARPLTIDFRQPDSESTRGGTTSLMELLQPTLVLYRDKKWPTVVRAPAYSSPSSRDVFAR